MLNHSLAQMPKHRGFPADPHTPVAMRTPTKRAWQDLEETPDKAIV